MHLTSRTQNHTLRVTALVLLACLGIGFADAQPIQGAQVQPAPQNSPLGRKLLEPLGEPLSQGGILYDARLRFEHAAQDGLSDANALTLRQRFGYETARFNGFYALAEGEYNWVLNNGDFGAYPGFGGRQLINLDNQRYVGAVGWRQNNQTYDTARLVVTALPDWTLDYTWNWQVNRVFGTKAPTTPLRRFTADNHFFNAQYTGFEGVTVGGYAYRLKLRNAAALSSNTYGLYVTGTIKTEGEYTFPYRLEYAYQTDNNHTAGADYSEHYFHLNLAAAREGYQLGIGFESLGGDGTRAFQTLLATLHAFNGWADTFLATPADGLRDYYLWLSGPVAGGISGRLEAHYYTAEANSGTYGHEFGFVLNKRLNSNLTALVKASYYDGRNGAPGAVAADKTKFWAQLDFSL